MRVLRKIMGSFTPQNIEKIEKFNIKTRQVFKSYVY